MQSVAVSQLESSQIQQTAQSVMPGASTAANPLTHYQIIRRNGAVVPFEPNKIAVALMKAFEDAATAEAKAREHQARNATRLSLSIGRPQPQPQP